MMPQGKKETVETHLPKATRLKFRKGWETWLLKIRLARGKRKSAYYRIVVAEASAPRDGRFVERLGS